MKPAPWSAVDEVDHRALDVRQARAVDQQADALVLEDGVAVALLVERQRVLEARAAAAAHADPQSGGLGDGRLRGEELADLLRALVSESDHCFIQYSDGISLRLWHVAVHIATPEELKARIEAGIPGARAEVDGRRAPLQRRRRRSPAFAGLSRIAQHRLVYDVFGAEIGGRIHALSIQTQASETENNA